MDSVPIHKDRAKVTDYMRLDSDAWAICCNVFMTIFTLGGITLGPCYTSLNLHIWNSSRAFQNKATDCRIKFGLCKFDGQRQCCIKY